MTDKPILFSGPMIRALLVSRKAQTRRVLKPQPEFRGGAGDYHDAEEWGWEDESGGHLSVLDIAPNGFHEGDRLWVREAWRADCYCNTVKPSDLSADSRVAYEADPSSDDPAAWGKLRPGMFMPRWASRLTLTVTDVRVQRVQEISEADAKAEGLATVSKDGKLWKWGIPDIDGLPGQDNHGWPWVMWSPSPVSAFCSLWNRLNASRGYGWDANPWVVAVSFDVAQANIDSVRAI